MAQNNKSNSSEIGFTLADIAKAAENAALQCYGVIDLSKSDSFRDEFMELLKKGNPNGAVARKRKDGYEIDLYIILCYGLRITEIVAEVQKKVKYDLEKKYHIPFKAINVYVQGIKASE